MGQAAESALMVRGHHGKQCLACGPGAEQTCVLLWLQGTCVELFHLWTCELSAWFESSLSQINTISTRRTACALHMHLTTPCGIPERKRVWWHSRAITDEDEEASNQFERLHPTVAERWRSGCEMQWIITQTSCIHNAQTEVHPKAGLILACLEVQNASTETPPRLPSVDTLCPIAVKLGL